MAVFSTIEKSELEGAGRLDAEYYQPAYLSISQRLTKFKTVRLDDIAYVTDGEHGSPIFDESSGIKYYSAQHVRDGFIDDTDVKTISKLIDDKNARSRLQVGDILLSTVGTIGFAGLATDDLLPANIDRHAARIALNKNTLDPEFLVAFLNSKYGRGQSIRQATGNVQLNLFIDKIKEFRVPVQNNSSISAHVQDALTQRKKSSELYAAAEKLLLEELGIKESDFEDELSYVIELSEAAERTDAEYFQPKYQKLLEKIRAKNPGKLGDLVSVKKGIEPGAEAYQEEGKLFIRVSSVSKFGIQKLDQKHLSNELYEKLSKDFEPQAGEILLTKDATTGIAYVVSESVQGIISGGILRLKLKTGVDPEYLALVINSLVGQMQAERDAGGSIIKHWKPDQVKNIEIPILPNATQQKIGDLVCKSHAARQKSKQLLESAKHQVEQLIEKGTT